MSSERDAPPAMVCRIGELTPREQIRRAELREALRQATEQVVETAEGYSFRFRADAGVFLEAAEWVTLERQCCSFLDFELEWRSSTGPSLHLTGRPGVKEFLAPGASELMARRS